MAKVEVRNVNLVYYGDNGETQALSSISLEVKEKEFVALVGPSGCGKSTLLSMVAGLLNPTTGMVYLDSEEVTGPSPKVGYMLQQDHLFRRINSD